MIEANAYKESEQIRGKGDARAAAIYAGAYTEDEEFYAFTRSMAAYQKAFKDKRDILLVDPESDFFRYLGNQKGDR